MSSRSLPITDQAAILKQLQVYQETLQNLECASAKVGAAVGIVALVCAMFIVRTFLSLGWGAFLAIALFATVCGFVSAAVVNYRNSASKQETEGNRQKLFREHREAVIAALKAVQDSRALAGEYPLLHSNAQDLIRRAEGRVFHLPPL